MKREVRSKSVGTKVTEAELRVLESRAERAGLTLSEWVRDVLLGSSVEMGTLAAERAILAEVLAMRTILLNFMLKVGEGTPIPAASKKLIEWADANKMKRALGETVRTMEHRAGWDATFSAPKSVSVTALVGGDDRVRDAHRESVRGALDEMEKYAQARIGGIGLKRYQQAGDLHFVTFSCYHRLGISWVRICPGTFRALA